MRLRGSPVSLFLVVLLCRSLHICAAVEDDARALLRFRDRVEVDPYGVLGGWGGEEGMDPCLWFGVECSGDGRVVSLKLENLYLKGTLAPELGKLTRLKSLILCKNSFTGSIPQEFGELHELVVLDLGDNNLSGPIPASLGKMLSLEHIVLRNNRIIGTMSQELLDRSVFSGLQTDIKNLSSDERSVKRTTIIRRLLQLGNIFRVRRHRNERNQTKTHALAAPTPTQTPSNSRKLSPSPSPTSTSPISLPPSKNVPSPSPAPSPSPFSGTPSLTPGSNSGLGAVPPSISVPLVPSLKSLPPSLATHHEVKQKNRRKVFGTIGVGMFFILASAIGFFLCYRTNKIVNVRPWATGLSGQLRKAFVEGVPSLKRVELEMACEDFSNVIGSLPGCNLYKGTLSTGVEIAVVASVITSAKCWSKQSESQFRKKISTLSKLNHKNFVNLIGYCEENKPFTRMMVFEYAPNGTLYEHLHIKEFESLDCTARLRVAMGVAYCLEYMHRLNLPVVLGNLDSTSIYLTDDYAAKISDLSFWKTPKETEPTSNSEAMVYKFGVILLELLSGRLPFSEEEDLVEQWASCFLTSELVDPSIKSLGEERTNALCAVIRSCISPDPMERLAMVEVVRRLREITGMSPEAATPKISPLWWAELEIVSEAT